jgi:spore coat polysaccharide biosynthesis protein SpsF
MVEEKMKRGGRVVLVLQARMGSTRLPGKSMLDLAGVPLVGRMIERLKRANLLDEIVLATTLKAEDDILEKLAADVQISCFRGSEDDLVDRYYQAASQFDADFIVRIPGDNPVIEPSEVDRIVEFHQMSDFDFSSNVIDFMGNGYPDGIGAEIFDFRALEIVWREVKDPYNREHIATNFYDYIGRRPASPGKFRIGTVPCPKEFSRPDVVLDVNTEEEYQFMRELYEYLSPRNRNFHITDVIDWYDNIYKQKGISDG